MHCAPNEPLPMDASVRQLFAPLAEFLEIPGITEIAINRPGEVFFEAGPLWQCRAMPALTLQRCHSLATAIASYGNQRIDQHAPLLCTQLPGLERIQIAVPPAVEDHTVSMTIRIPDASTRELDAYQQQGFFDHYQWARPAGLAAHRDQLDPMQRELLACLEQRRLAQFLKTAIRHKLNLVFVGDTGCGKTSLMKAACHYIPADERLITIEDVRELFLPRHPNRVHMLYNKGDQGTATITPAELIASCMRMKPDRVLLAELRGSEAFDFLKLLTTGHSGAISSFHAESCALALERYVFMCKEHPQAAIYDTDALKRLVALTIDIILHIRVRRVYADDGTPLRKERYVSEVSYDPVAKLRERTGAVQLPHAGGQP